MTVLYVDGSIDLGNMSAHSMLVLLQTLLQLALILPMLFHSNSYLNVQKRSVDQAHLITLANM